MLGTVMGVKLSKRNKPVAALEEIQVRRGRSESGSSSGKALWGFGGWGAPG